MVDQLETDTSALYVNLVMVTAHPKYTEEQKANAQKALDSIGAFMGGITTNGEELPPNLKPLILSNLVEKQTALYEELKISQDDKSLIGSNSSFRNALHRNMVLLRATRRFFNNDMAAYQVEPATVRAAVEVEAQKTDFIKFQEQINEQSKEIHSSMASLRGRSTSSDVIYSSAGASGNISGRGFPENTWSITYDDGPGGKTTPTVIDNLKNHNMKATFFMLAQQVERLPSTAQSIKDAGMDIASHSYTHAQLTKVGPQKLESEIGGAKKVIEDKLGVKVKLFRLPYGAGVSAANVRQKIAEHDMIHVFWNVDTLDWQDKNPQSILRRTLKQMGESSKNSGVILFHDIHPQSVVASNLLMDHLATLSKTKVCTVQGVVDQLNSSLPTCK